MANVTEETKVMEEVVEVTTETETTAIAGVEKETFGRKIVNGLKRNGKKIAIGLGGVALFALGVSAGKKAVSAGSYEDDYVTEDNEETEPEESEE